MVFGEQGREGEEGRGNGESGGRRLIRKGSSVPVKGNASLTQSRAVGKIRRKEPWARFSPALLRCWVGLLKDHQVDDIGC